MLDLFFHPLWALHIGDGQLHWPWLLGGFIGMILLALPAMYRLRDEEIPLIALMTSAFFVASFIHVPVPGSSVHLLFNGLVGVILGRRAALAIPVALALQAVFGHGGFTTIGINSCIMVLPALLAWQLFWALQRVPWVREPWFRAGLVSGSVALWIVSLVFSVNLLITNWSGEQGPLMPERALALAFHPLTLLIAVLLGGLAAWAERRLENAPEFPLGMLIGEVAVLVTVLLNYLVKVWGGPQEEGWAVVSLIALILNLPLALVEGTVLGFTVGFLVRVKPEMLGWTAPEKAPCTVDSLP